MSIDKSLSEIKKYNDLFEKQKENMSEIEKIMFSPDSLNCVGNILEIFKKSRNEQVPSN